MLWGVPLVWVLSLCVFTHTASVEAAPRMDGKSTACRQKSKVHYKSRAKATLRTQPQNSVLSRGKAAVFSFEGDDVEPLRDRVIRLLQAKGMQVNTTLRPVDTAQQYRDMSVVLGLAVYVHGQLKPQGRRQAVAIITIRSGVTGKAIATTRIVGDRRSLPAVVSETLWNRVHHSIVRACMGAAKPGRRINQPLHIEAGSPIEGAPLSWEQS